MMIELCNHHAFLDYNAHKPRAVVSARYADGDRHRDGRGASGGKRVAVAPAVVDAGNRARAPAAREEMAAVAIATAETATAVMLKPPKHPA